MSERISPLEDSMLETRHRADESVAPMQMALGIGQALPPGVQERLEVIQWGKDFRSQGSGLDLWIEIAECSDRQF